MITSTYCVPFLAFNQEVEYETMNSAEESKIKPSSIVTEMSGKILITGYLVLND